MSDEVYQRLREFLDRLPGGYPKTPSGVEIKILKKLFSPEDAELTMKLPREPEELSVIASRIGMEEKELEQRLEDLAKRGLIYRERVKDKTRYQAFHFVVGIYEFQLSRLDREFCELFEEYGPYLGMNWMMNKTSQMRVIPVQSAVDTQKTVAPYNQVREMVKKQEVISVQQCICRKEQAIMGKHCDRPQEICLGFGHFAQFYIDNGWGRKISVSEAMDLLDLAEEKALVLSPANAQDLLAICCCCPCCCPLIRAAKLMPRPRDFINSYYQANIDPELCSACGTCLERCQVNAIKEGEEVMEVIDGKCIGCGLCVPFCPEEAIALEKLPDKEDPPEDYHQTLVKILKERGLD